MTRPLAILAGLMFVSPVLAQRDGGIYTQPNIPSARELDRLNLSLAWKTFVPVDGRGDGIATIQLVDDQIFVQTRSNAVVALSANTGEEIWRMVMPKHYLPVFPLAVNRQLVIVVNGPRVYLLDRRNGKQKYNLELPSTVVAGLVADDNQCFVVLSNNQVISIGLNPEDIRPGLRVRPYFDQPDMPSGVKLETQTPGAEATPNNRTPSLAVVPTLRPPYRYESGARSPSVITVPTLHAPYRLDNGNRTPSLQLSNDLSRVTQEAEVNSEDKPRILWQLQAQRRMEQTPLMYGEFLVVAGTDQSVFVCDKYAERYNRIRHEYLADNKLSAPIGQYGPDLYLNVADGNAYWVNIENFRNSEIPVKHVKRYLVGSAVDQKPVTTDDSVFLAGSQAGVTRLDRTTFEKVWTNTEVDRVLSVNPNVVYASDRRGNLVVLDRARGLKLASIDIRAFAVPVTNHRDDRMYLAANNGILLCLNDRGFRRPELLRPKEPQSRVDAKLPDPKKEEPKKEEPKKEEPKKEEPKAEEKKEADKN